MGAVCHLPGIHKGHWCPCRILTPLGIPGESALCGHAEAEQSCDCPQTQLSWRYLSPGGPTQIPPSSVSPLGAHKPWDLMSVTKGTQGCLREQAAVSFPAGDTQGPRGQANTAGLARCKACVRKSTGPEIQTHTARPSQWRLWEHQEPAGYRDTSHP